MWFVYFKTFKLFDRKGDTQVSEHQNLIRFVMKDTKNVSTLQSFCRNHYYK